METTALQSSKGKSPVLKWLLILGGVTGAGYLIKKIFFNGNNIELPTIDELNQANTEIVNDENFAINSYTYCVLASKNWAMAAIKDAIRLGKTFEQYLYDYGVARYVREGAPTDEALLTNFGNLIKGTTIKLRRNPSSVELIEKKAKQEGVSYEEKLRSYAIWLCIYKLTVQRKSEYNKMPGNSNLDDQSNSDAQSGFKGLSGHSL